MSRFHPKSFRSSWSGVGPKRPTCQKLLRYNGVFNASAWLGYCHGLNICVPLEFMCGDPTWMGWYRDVEPVGGDQD